MTAESILTELLKQTNPSALAWVAGAGVTLKFSVDLLKRFAPNLKGNAVQTVTGALSLLAAVVQAGIANVASGGVSGQEIGSIVIVGALTYLAAVGTNETLTNRNPKPAEPDLKAALREDAALKTINDQATERADQAMGFSSVREDEAAKQKAARGA